MHGLILMVYCFEKKDMRANLLYGKYSIHLRTHLCGDSCETKRDIKISDDLWKLSHAENHRIYTEGRK